MLELHEVLIGQQMTYLHYYLGKTFKLRKEAGDSPQELDC